jgi:hypothetical protein
VNQFSIIPVSPIIYAYFPSGPRNWAVWIVVFDNARIVAQTSMTIFK